MVSKIISYRQILKNFDFSSIFFQRVIFVISILFSIFLVGKVLITSANFDYFHFFYSNNIIVDYTLGFILSFTPILFFFYLSISKNNNYYFILIFLWIIKIFYIFNFSIFVDSIYFLDKDGYFTNALMLDNKNFRGYNNIWYAKIHSGTDFMHMVINKIFIFWPKSIYSLKVFFSLLVFISNILITKYIIYYSNKKIGYIYFIFINLLPSFNVFGSDISKDIFVLFLVSMFFYRSIDIKSFFRFFELLFYCLIIYFIRKWISIICIFSLVFIFYNYYKVSKFYLIFLIALAFLSFYLFLYKYFVGETYNFNTIILQFRKSFINGGSSFEPYNLENIYDWILYPLLSLKLLFIPLFRFDNLFLGFFSIENILLLAIILFFIFRTLHNIFSTKKYGFKVVIPSLIYVISWCCLYSPIIGNYGALIRYKITVIPIAFIFLLLFFFKSLNNK